MDFKNTIGLNVKIFTKNNFVFSGVVIDYRHSFLEIDEDKKKKRVMINVDNISEMEIL